VTVPVAADGETVAVRVICALCTTVEEEAVRLVAVAVVVLELLLALVDE
jgi:hypothetical protein